MALQTFLCWNPEDADEADARRYEEYYADHAAEAHAKYLNDHDFEFLDGVVAVKHPDGKVEHYDIGHYSTIHFTADLSLDQPGDELGEEAA